jgi:hypothetical protein
MAQDQLGELRHAAIIAARRNLMIWSAAVHWPRVDPDAFIASCATPWLRSTYLDFMKQPHPDDVAGWRKRAKREKRCPTAPLRPSPASNDGRKPPAKNRRRILVLNRVVGPLPSHCAQTHERVWRQRVATWSEERVRSSRRFRRDQTLRLDVSRAGHTTSPYSARRAFLSSLPTRSSSRAPGRKVFSAERQISKSRLCRYRSSHET